MGSSQARLRQADIRVRPQTAVAFSTTSATAPGYVISGSQRAATAYQAIAVLSPTPDWWRREGGEQRGPRLELCAEMRQRASVRLFMMRPAILLSVAREVLSLVVWSSPGFEDT
jgi:hypothetical protein